MIRSPGVELEETCGACPHQFQGTVDGNPAFFRLRHSAWRFCIIEPGGNPIGPGLTPDKKVLYYKDGEYQPGQDCGVMIEAEEFIMGMVREFRDLQAAEKKATDACLSTKHLPFHGEVTPTIAGKLAPEDLTDEEKSAIAQGIFGYCEGHGVLYRKWALPECVVPSIFEDRPRSECKEWGADPK